MSSHQVKCEKCGTLNESIEGKCSECGDYLYQFYIKQRRRHILKSFGITGAVIIVIAGLVIWEQFSKTPEPSDPVMADLKRYLELMSSTQEYLKKTEEGKNYQRFIQENATEEDKIAVLSSLGWESEPTFDDYLSDDQMLKGKWDQYWSALQAYMKKLVKGKRIKDKMKIQSDYFSVQYNAFNKITPLTAPVKEIHEHLLNGTRAQHKGHFDFYSGMELGYITNVQEKDDGTIQWSYSKYNKDHSESYSRNHDIATDELAIFERLLGSMVEQKNLEDEYRKTFPGIWLQKKLISTDSANQ
jgi:hypothetical protein